MQGQQERYYWRDWGRILLSIILMEGSKCMTDKVTEFKNGYSVISSRFELLNLEKEIKEFMKSEGFRMLSDKEMDALDDLLIEVINKKEYFQTGLNPGRMKQWLNDSRWRNLE